MSSMGMWCVAALTDEDARRFVPLARPLIQAHAEDPVTGERWRRWLHAPGRVHGLRPAAEDPRRLDLDEESRSFLRLAGHPLTQDTTVGNDCQSASVPEVEPFIVVTSRCDPVAALCHGLGPARAALLPGFFG